MVKENQFNVSLNSKKMETIWKEIKAEICVVERLSASLELTVSNLEQRDFNAM